MVAQAESNDAAPLEDILQEADECTDGDKVSVDDLLESFGSRSLGPMLILFGLLALFPPIGAVPGVPIVLGCVLALYSVQFLFGARHIWVPDRVRRMNFDHDKLSAAREKMAPWLKRADRLFTERMTFMTGPVWARLTGIAALVHALLMIPLEFISAVAIPGLALVFFGAGLTARDGLMMLLGWAATLGALYAAFAFVPWDKVF